MAAAVATLPPVEIPVPSRAVPEGFTSSVRGWWSAGNKAAAVSEERLLRKLPYYLPAGVPTPSPAPPVTARSGTVYLDTPKKAFLNTVSFLPGTPAPPHRAPPATVVLHGYGAGLGFFFQNCDTFGQWAARRGAPVYMVDWLGMGRSARVPFTVKAKREHVDARVAEAEGFFVDSLEQWRQKKGLEKMTLVGHSLGAYLSAAYALRYPERVARLVLLSPAGIPRGPDDTSVLAKELDTSPQGAEGDEPHQATKVEFQDIRDAQQRDKRSQSLLIRVGSHLWEEGYSPFGVVRALGVFGPWLVGKYSSRRFHGLTEEETRDMHEYILNITVAKGSGEYCISHLLAPGAHARKPIVDRIDQLRIPVTFVYGDHDWMDPKGGYESVKRLKAVGVEAKTYIIPNSGHHLYLDNPSATNDLLRRELDATVPRS